MVFLNCGQKIHKPGISWSVICGQKNPDLKDHSTRPTWFVSIHIWLTHWFVDEKKVIVVEKKQLSMKKNIFVDEIKNLSMNAKKLSMKKILLIIFFHRQFYDFFFIDKKLSMKYVTTE